MKKTTVFSVLLLCLVLALCACAGKEDEDKSSKRKNSETEQSGPGTNEAAPTQDPSGNTPVPTIPHVDPVPTPESFAFSAVVSDTDRMVKEAIEQYKNEDYTRLSEPVKYYVLWLGFTHVTFGDLDFRMTDFDREYLEAVALNYEKTVESVSDHNVDITVYLYFVEDAMPLTRYPGEDWFYLDITTAMPFIEQYSAGKEIDTVLTTIQTDGEENRQRNEDKDGYGEHYAILGLKTDGIESPIGYSTFNLCTPAEGTYPLEDPEIPSLYATAVAVHEWMHQLEYLKTMLGVEYPDTHAYAGPPSYPHYQKYIADLNDYDFFEFYKLVLKGQCPYTDENGVKRVGMYPKMWPLIKRNVLNLGTFTIQASDKSGYLTGTDGDNPLTLTDEVSTWIIRYSGDGRFILSPGKYPNLRMDLGNAWDSEGNTVGVWIYTGYVDAQSWILLDNGEGTYSIQTPYPSGRLVTVTQKGEQARIYTDSAVAGVQKWIIKKVEDR